MVLLQYKITWHWKQDFRELANETYWKIADITEFWNKSKLVNSWLSVFFLPLACNIKGNKVEFHYFIKLCEKLNASKFNVLLILLLQEHLLFGDEEWELQPAPVLLSSPGFLPRLCPICTTISSWDWGSFHFVFEEQSIFYVVESSIGYGKTKKIQTDTAQILVAISSYYLSQIVKYYLRQKGQE
jgi:hypothetical protein